MLELRIEKYSDDFKEKWDNFVINKSVNGTFLQSKQFLDYHGERFQDASLVIYKGNDTVVAVVPACTILDGDKKVFSAHAGSTFGGIIIGDSFYNIEHVEAIMTSLEEYLVQENYQEVRMKCTSEIFSKGNVNLLYYFLFQRGYTSYDEISCYIDFENYKDDVISNFTSGRRRDYKYSLKQELTFRELNSREDIERFYAILCENLEKFGAKPVHSLQELVEFKEERLQDVMEFYGVFLEETMIAGSMVFKFADRVFHTQYLAADQNYLKMFPMNFLDTNLIQVAKDKGFRYFSFGTSTEEHGKVLNKHLAQFKEGFGTEYGLNRTFVKELQ
ncbi:MAG: GNAT family N-acetyltransferase [Lachnospiraceae bacterium]|nr:GNAT family N-acetyltransferase [Lachnospiraceae bacterium]